MKKWILIGGGVIIAIILVLVVGFSNLGPMIKRAVNTYGPRITKTVVRLVDVDVGRGAVTGETIIIDKTEVFVLRSPMKRGAEQTT